MLLRRSCCLNQVKDTNLKAIHNTGLVVSSADLLFESGQRYKFESNSQQHVNTNYSSGSCLNQVKDTNLKAIHNLQMDGFCSEQAV